MVPYGHEKNLNQKCTFVNEINRNLIGTMLTIFLLAFIKSSTRLYPLDLPIKELSNEIICDIKSELWYVKVKTFKST